MPGLYEVTVRTTYNGKDCVNVFGYANQNPISSPNALELLTLMGFVPTGDPLAYPAGTLFASWLGTVSSGVVFIEAEARELYSLTDFYLAPILPGTVGALAGTAMSPYNAFALATNRVRVDIRRGQKRLVGVTEESVGAFGGLTGSTQTDLDALAGKMSEELVGASTTYSPAIISRERVVVSPGVVEYRLYADEETQLAHTAFPVVWTAKDTITTQNSRKK